MSPERATFDLARIGRGLPVADQAATTGLADALTPAARLVVQAPPGTGKTTFVPALAANAVGGRIVVTQPRRVAARAAAHRLASLAGDAVGGLVGYRVRGDARVGPSTIVEFCTTGVLLRRLLAEPDLPRVSAVILDEVHERQLDSDLVVGMVRELAELRDDLTVVAMSATLAADRFAELLGAPGDVPAGTPARVIRVEGALHPLEVAWAPPRGAAPLDARGVTDPFLTHVAATTREALATWPGDALVFLPGVREVERVTGLLAGAVPGVSVLPLHGRLSTAEQQRVLAKGDGRRVVVATSVAESSLTVPGVRIVVDSGLAREPRYDAIRGMSGLVTRTESRSSAEQRAGRAARESPGVVVRCFAAETWSRLAPAPTPEILTADLTRAVLDLACWGTPRGEGLALLDPLPPGTLVRAEETLRDLGAIDADGRATPAGHRMARVPVDPRLARALFIGAAAVGARRAAEIVAALENDQRAAGADLAALVRDLRSGRGPGAAAWRTESKRLTRLATTDPGAEHGVPAGTSGEEIGVVVAAAYPDRIARHRGGDSRAYLLASGTAADLPPDSSLGRPEWLAVAQMDRTRAPGGRQGSEREEVTWSGGQVGAVRVRRLGAIDLAVTPIPVDREAGVAAVRAALTDGRGEAGLGLLHWTEAATTLRRRMAFAHARLGDPWPAVGDDALTARLDEWLGPELLRLAEGAPPRSLDLVSALRRLLPWPEAGTFDEVVPERLPVPTGSRIRLTYPEDPAERPVLAVKLQECFGLTETPRVAGVPVLFHLLSPAGWPLAVTDDLASFWVNAYPGVRAENRGRYAKHPWPEDPLTAPPQRGTKRSGR
jgi:ATP-dependent helicase HrpB